jgi:hypothetical protein
VFLVGLFFGPEDGGNTALKNIGRFSVGCMILYSRRYNYLCRRKENEISVPVNIIGIEVLTVITMESVVFFIMILHSSEAA